MNPEEAIRQEFNRWAEAGRGEEMEAHHSSIAEQTMRLMDLKAGERVLDLGCGTGWATRILARLVADGPEGFGQVVGMDIAEEMIRRGRAASRDFENILYVWASAQHLPPSINDGMSFFRAALDRQVITVPGDFFDVDPGKRRGGRNSRFRRHLRFSFGPPMAKLDLALDRIRALVADAAKRG